jgi:mannose-6-phosphate isomerase-like protein (cupin superfamily)
MSEVTRSHPTQLFAAEHSPRWVYGLSLEEITMRFPPALCSASLCCLCLCVAASCLGQATPKQAEAAPYPLRYIRLYADEKGVSHFKEEQLAMQVDAARAARNVQPIEAAKGATLLRLRPGTVETWHRAPRRQYLFVVKGRSEVTAGDGQKRELVPGDMMLMDDTTGQGHITRVLGQEEHVALFIPLE